MKINSILAAGALTVALSLTGFAQHTHGQSAQRENKSGKMGDMMGKPTAERTVDGLRVQFWLITQDEHKKMMQERMKSENNIMGEMKHEMMPAEKDSAKTDHKMEGEMQHDMKGMDHSKMGKDMKPDTKEGGIKKMMEAMMVGTHHVMVKVFDDKAGKAIGEGHIQVVVTAPSGKNSTVRLTEMMDHFGGGVSLTEKGSFKLDLSFKSGGKTHNAQFEYDVK
jgi:hypothetical protein